MTRSDPRKGEFTITSLEDYLSCKRLYYYRKILGLLPKEANTAAHFGSSIHAGVGTYYKARLQEGPDKAYLTGIQAFSAVWASEQVMPDSKRNLDTGLEILSRYFEAYKGDGNNFIPDLIESPFTVIMPNGTTLNGRLDRVERVKDFITVIDTKTSSMALTDWYFKSYNNSFQISGYFYAVSQLCGDCDCILIDGIKVPYSAPTVRKPEQDNFVRRTFQRSELQMAEFINTYDRITNDILFMLKTNPAKPEHFHQCPTACGNYGGCKFLPICMHGFDHPAVKDEFVTKEVEVTE